MTSSPLSPRRRRLRWTAALLGAASLISLGVGIVLHQRARPARYRPDERPTDITSALSRSLPTNAPQPRFTHVTDPAGLAGYRNFAGHRTSQLPEDMGPGLAWGDFDNDGDDDLFLVSAGGALDLPTDQLLPCRLFENLGDGAFRNVPGFPELRLRGFAAAWADYDGDGFLDLAVTGYDTLRLLHNEGGTGRFVPDPRLPDLPGFWSGLAWGDFDQDRRLDLYVCRYVAFTPNEADRDQVSDQLGTAVPYTLNPASYPAARNALFRQAPDGAFTNVAPDLGVENPEGRSLGALWHDFDQDGWLDLYVANDVSDNVLFRNLGGRFEDISHPAWVADYRSAMGLAAADVDRDGDDDLFITHWVAQENGLYENMWANLNPARPVPAPRETSAPSADPAPRRHPLRFVDIADRQGLGQISLPYVGWGAEFADLDHDGWLDLLVANGSTLEIEGPPPRRLQPQELFLFWNRTGTGFHNLAPLNPEFTRKEVSRGLATADVDQDGDLDLAVADLGGGVRLFRNDMAAGAWLKVRLRHRNASGNPNGFGHGSTAVAWVNGVPLRRTVNSVSYLSQSSLTLHWGLGTATAIDRFEVHWLAGETQVFGPLAANAFHEVREGDPQPRLLGPSRSLTDAPTLPSPASATSPSGATAGDREQIRRFWSLQRAGMQALKSRQDPAAAIPLFREALALNPGHQDTRYYLAQSLAQVGDRDAALAELAELQRLDPGSHRAWQQWGLLRAQGATHTPDLAEAESALQRAYDLNPEETGVLLSLGAMALLRHQPDVAEDRLAAVTRTNPKATGAWFLRGFLAWYRGDAPRAAGFLRHAQESRGPEWQPKGATSEGDVRRRQHAEATPLATFWEDWDGTADPDAAFAALARRVAPPDGGVGASP